MKPKIIIWITSLLLFCSSCNTMKTIAILEGDQVDSLKWGQQVIVHTKKQKEYDFMVEVVNKDYLIGSDYAHLYQVNRLAIDYIEVRKDYFMHYNATAVLCVLGGLMAGPKGVVAGSMIGLNVFPIDPEVTSNK